MTTRIKKSKAVTVSLPVDLYVKIKRAGEKRERKVAAQIRYALKEIYDKEENNVGDGTSN